MTKDTWIWTYGNRPGKGGFFVELAKQTLLDEILSRVAGTLLRVPFLYRPANRLILWLDSRAEVVLEIPISREQMAVLDTDGIWVDDD